MDLDTLKKMKCPKCGEQVDDVGFGYSCSKRVTGNIDSACDFFISYERFHRHIKGMLAPKNVYEADKVDRSGWGW